MANTDIVIIGAGISGLSFAHHCARAGMSHIVLERNERTGGTIHTHRIGAGEQEFWLELGAHTCYNSYGRLIDLMEECAILDTIIAREKFGYRVWADGQLRSIVSQLSFPGILIHAPRIFMTKKSGRSVASYYSKIVGKRNFRDIFSPLFSAVICQDADDFPADLLFRKRPRRKDILRSYTFSQGIQTITDSCLSQGEIPVRTGVEVTDIRAHGNVFSVHTSGGETHESRAVVLATPVDIAAALLGKAFPELSGSLSSIGASRVESIGVVVKKDSLSLPRIAGIIPKKEIFFSVVSRDTVPHDTYRGFTFHFRPGVTDRNTMYGRIAEVLGVGMRDLERAAEKSNVVPALRVGHAKLAANINRLISGKNLFLTGNYFGGMAIEDCVSRSHTEFQRFMELFV